ncbi:MAG: hypothetical protein QF699_05540, partial [Candidatus Poseidoniaceae archaeon]|nr:hypothetical protein [Candidatus Poseidoniaceae archaeon]
FKGFQSSKSDSFSRAETPLSSISKERRNSGCFIAYRSSLLSMIELLGNPEIVEDALEAVGNKTEEWTDRWWWKPLRFLTYVLPFAAVGVYYYWFL